MAPPTAAAGSTQTEVESLQQQLDNERMKHEKELEKETERREADRQKFELEIEKLDEEVTRLKAESAAQQGCCTSCPVKEFVLSKMNYSPNEHRKECFVCVCLQLLH